MRKKLLEITTADEMMAVSVRMPAALVAYLDETGRRTISSRSYVLRHLVVERLQQLGVVAPAGAS